jgi:hypothetical protein
MQKDSERTGRGSEKGPAENEVNPSGIRKKDR